MSKKLITILLLLQGFLLISESTFGQQNDTRVKVCDDGISHIEDKGHLWRHYIDSIPRNILMHMKGGDSNDMTQAQKQLGYFHFLIYDESLYKDDFYLFSFDSLYQKMLYACEEFGFFQFVNVLNDIQEHRNQNIKLFHCDTTSLIFNNTDDQFDQELHDLRQKLYKLRDEYYYEDIYAETIRKYIITHRKELIKRCD